MKCKLFIIASLLLFASKDAISQHDSTSQFGCCETTEYGKEPEYPGGETVLYDYIRSNVKRPVGEGYDQITGIVYVGFVIEKDGSIGSVVVKKGLHPDFDKEAIRLIKSMPRWTPGENCCGVPVRISYIMPVKFNLE